MYAEQTFFARLLQNVCLGLWVAAAAECIAAHRAYSQEPAPAGRDIQVDLATSGTVTLSIAANTRYRLAALYALPGIEYSLSETIEWQQVTALPAFPQKAMLAVCPIKAEYEAILTARTEAGVKPHVQAIQRILEAPPQPQCTAAEISAGGLAVSRTKREWVVGPYERGQVITLTITRPAVDNAAAPAWVRVLQTPAEGSWDITYGFGFIWQQWSPPDRYFSRDSAEVFVVTAARDRRKLLFTPTIVFRWADPIADRKGFVWDRIVAALGIAGFEVDNPFLAVGTGTTFRRNLSLHAGIAVHGVQRLLDKYQPGQVLTESLDGNQLQERSLAVNPYLSMSVRLSANPFSGDNNQQKAVPAPQQVPPEL